MAESQSVSQDDKYIHPHTRQTISPTDLHIIPKFESNICDLPIFIEACEEFLHTYSDKKNPKNPFNLYLAKLIKSRLQGDAKHLVWLSECETWDHIKEVLEAEFGDKRTEEDLFLDLVNLKCDAKRNYHGMGAEIRTLLGLLLAKCKLNIQDSNELRIKEDSYSKIALRTYIRNLYFFNKDIANPVRFQNPKTLEEAMKLVAEEMNFQHSCSKLQSFGAQVQPGKSTFGITPQLHPHNLSFGSVSNKQPQVQSSQPNFFPQTQNHTNAKGGVLFGACTPLDAKQENQTTTITSSSVPLFGIPKGAKHVATIFGSTSSGAPFASTSSLFGLDSTKSVPVSMFASTNNDTNTKLQEKESSTDQ